MVLKVEQSRSVCEERQRQLVYHLNSLAGVAALQAEAAMAERRAREERFVRGDDSDIGGGADRGGGDLVVIDDSSIDRAGSVSTSTPVSLASTSAPTISSASSMEIGDVVVLNAQDTNSSITNALPAIATSYEQQRSLSSSSGAAVRRHLRRSLLGFARAWAVLERNRQACPVVGLVKVTGSGTTEGVFRVGSAPADSSANNESSNRDGTGSGGTSGSSYGGGGGSVEGVEMVCVDAMSFRWEVSSTNITTETATDTNSVVVTNAAVVATQLTDAHSAVGGKRSRSHVDAGGFIEGDADSGLSLNTPSKRQRLLTSDEYADSDAEAAHAAAASIASTPASSHTLPLTAADIMATSGTGVPPGDIFNQFIARNTSNSDTSTDIHDHGSTSLGGGQSGRGTATTNNGAPSASPLAVLPSALSVKMAFNTGRRLMQVKLRTNIHTHITQLIEKAVMTTGGDGKAKANAGTAGKSIQSIPSLAYPEP
jgi:hypothetical protein